MSATLKKLIACVHRGRRRTTSAKRLVELSAMLIREQDHRIPEGHR